jgi:RNA polymerase sigma-70 factor (ECF subfamily)
MMAAAAVPHAAHEPFETLFLREYPRAVAIAARITGDAGEAEDAAQEAFVQLARRGRIDANSARWVYAACVHHALNAIRRRMRQSRRETRSAHLQIASELNAQAQADPQSIAVRHSDRAAVRAALLRLREADAALLAMRYGGLSYQECAGALGVAVNQIGTRLARAERALKKELL